MLYWALVFLSCDHRRRLGFGGIAGVGRHRTDPVLYFPRFPCHLVACGSFAQGQLTAIARNTALLETDPLKRFSEPPVIVLERGFGRRNLFER